MKIQNRRHLPQRRKKYGNMMRQSLCKVGNSVVMTLPEGYIGQNGLSVGSQVRLHMRGAKLIVETSTKLQ